MTHSRRRAVTACEHCRSRKIKCSNERPECRSCVRLGTKCSYDARNDHSSFDPASLLILEKLNQILSKLDRGPETENNQFPLDRPISDGRGDCPNPSDQITNSQYGCDTPVVPLALDGLQLPSSYSSPDWVLEWPIFNHQFCRGYLTEELLVAERLSSLQEPERSSHGGSRGGICEDDVPGLVAKFLRLVHIKNPILDPKGISQQASRVAEDGAGWDASSCLVLLACALGAIAVPYAGPNPEVGHPNSISTPGMKGDRATADSYYQLACRRLGLLDQSAVAAQCYLLSGIYLMYILRPLQAQSRFFQASSIYATYLKGQLALKQRRVSLDEELEPVNLRLEQCLYWSCFKSECEIRQELNLPVSGLAELAYPYMFPSPPTPDNESRPGLEEEIHQSVPTPASSSDCQSLAQGASREVEEQSWYYYLSDIALRRIANRVLHCFYREDPTSWSVLDLHEATAVVEDLETQLENWKSTVPSRFRGIFTSEASDELVMMTHGRYIGIKCYMYRPFLYYAIHHQDCPSDMYQIVHPFAQKALQNIATHVTFGSYHHRHHGTWLCCRELTTFALLLLASHKSGLVAEGPSSCEVDCGQLVQICIDMLRYWESESPDIARAGEVIENFRGQMLNSP